MIILTAALCLYELLYSLLLTCISSEITSCPITSGSLQRITLSDILDRWLLMLRMLSAELSGHRCGRDHSHIFLGDQIREVGSHETIRGGGTSTHSGGVTSLR